LTEDRRAEIVAAINRNEPYRAIMKSCHLSPRTLARVRRLLPRRPRPYRRRGELSPDELRQIRTVRATYVWERGQRRRIFPPDELQQIRTLRARGVPLKQLRKELGIGLNVLYGILRNGNDRRTHSANGD
jgi:DNA invertase Pin-like site-specific DNA recombinase